MSIFLLVYIHSNPQTRQSNGFTNVISNIFYMIYSHVIRKWISEQLSSVLETCQEQFRDIFGDRDLTIFRHSITIRPCRPRTDLRIPIEVLLPRAEHNFPFPVHPAHLDHLVRSERTAESGEGPSATAKSGIDRPSSAAEESTAGSAWRRCLANTEHTVGGRGAGSGTAWDHACGCVPAFQLKEDIVSFWNIDFGIFHDSLSKSITILYILLPNIHVKVQNGLILMLKYFPFQQRCRRDLQGDISHPQIPFPLKQHQWHPPWQCRSDGRIFRGWAFRLCGQSPDSWESGDQDQTTNLNKLMVSCLEQCLF